MVKQRMPVSAYLKAIFFLVAAAAALFAAAGTVAIPGFWAYLAIFAIVMIVSFAALDPDLLRERMTGRQEAAARDELDERGTKPVIPNRNNRKQPFRFSKRLYKLRWRIESAFNRLKDFRRIATRYDRLARNYLASVCLVAALVWWI